MRIKLITILLCSLSLQTQAACIPLMNRLLKKPGPFAYTDEYKYRQKIGSLEGVTNFLRRRKENPEPALNIKIFKKIALMNEHIMNGTHAPNERRWRTFFREFEANFISFKRSNALVDIIRKNPDDTPSQFFYRLSELNYPNAYIEFIQRRLSEVETLENLRIALDLEKKNTLVQIGNNYQEYRMVRGNLEELSGKPECNERCKEMITRLQEGIGASSQKEKLRHALVVQDAEPIDIAIMRELLYQEPLFVLTKLKRERNAEFFRFLFSFISQTEILDRLFGYIYKSKLLGKTKATQLFQMIFNAQARKHHFPKIQRVLFGPQEPEKALDQLRNLNTSVADDELLVTFSRRVDTLAKNKWDEIKKVAQEEDPEFLKRMENAQEQGTARGDLSPTQEPSFVKRLAILLAAGVPTVGYFYFDAQPTAVDDADPGDDGIEVDPTLPLPEKGEVIAFDGEEDRMIEEATEVIRELEEGIDNQETRGPSSIAKLGKRRPLFTRLWCSLFSCAP